MSNERPPLPEGWEWAGLSIKSPDGDIVFSPWGEGGAEVCAPCRYEDVDDMGLVVVPLAVLRAFVAECERVRGGGEMPRCKLPVISDDDGVRVAGSAHGAIQWATCEQHYPIGTVLGIGADGVWREVEG